MTRSALRPFWWAYWPCVVLFLLGSVAGAIGPRVQAAVAPIHADMKALAIDRTPERMCWDYASRKLREAATDDLDTFLYVSGHERMVVAPVGEADGMPWRVSQAPAVGPYRKRWCIDLPAGVPDGEPIRFELTAYYRGPWGLWRTPLPWPPVSAKGLPVARTTTP